MKFTKKIYVVFIILIISSSCLEHCPAENKGNKIINSYAKEKNRRDGWRLDKSGCYYYDDKTREIFLYFNEYGDEVGKDETRAMIVNAVEEFLKKINGAPNEEQFLIDRPFTYRELKFELALYRKNGKMLRNANIGVILDKGELTYFSSGGKEANTRYEKINTSSETYEDALQVVKTQGRHNFQKD